MAKPKKTFTQQEILWVCRYIDRKFKLNSCWPKDDTKIQIESQKAFEKIRRETDSGLVEAWCGQWLDNEQRNQLLTSLRAWRKREGALERKKNITLEHKAWLYLSKLAKRDNVTISRFLIERLEKEYMDRG